MSSLRVEKILPRCAAWALDEAQLAALRYLVWYGGRSGGKSWAIARLLVIIAAIRPVRILCLRETQKSMAESSKSTIEGAIRDLGMSHIFTSTISSIKCDNGSVFLFHGMSTVTETRLRSMYDIDIAYIEEGQEVSASSWDSLEATIRKRGSQIWVAFNPKSRADIVYRLFVGNPVKPERSSVIKVNYDDNPWVSEETLASVRYDEQYNYDVYRWKWLGELQPDSGMLRVLPIGRLRKCVELYPKHIAAFAGAKPDVGLDVADMGPDKNAMATRRGPCLTEMRTWHGSMSLRDTSHRADAHAERIGARNLFFDAGGLGAGVRSDLIELGRRPYFVRPVKFGSAPDGADVKFDRHQRNRDAFALKNGQLAWALQLRASNTELLSDGHDVDPARCLFINPELLVSQDTSQLLEQLNQPTWDDGDGGKIKIAKAQEGENSPDMYDAAALAFGNDSRNGLHLDLR